ncbi:RHS repeat-associated core domain-containing protein [Pseudoxanthomonas wuyuanensis]|nr:RHS repeat-associated core domain-containing protein [Pseudoxanthomonas wuyuanensis]
MTTESLVYPLKQQTATAGGGRDDAPEFTVAGTFPEHNAGDIVPSSMIALRFTRRVDATKLRQGSVALIGPGGITGIDVGSAEGGRLLFVKPRQPLFPESKYILAVSRLKDLSGNVLPLSTLEFETIALDARVGVSKSESSQEQNRKIVCRGYGRIAPCNARGRVENGVWTPGRDNTKGRWRLYTKAYQILPNTALERSLKYSNRTVISGRIAQIDEKPVAGISVYLGDKTAVTNEVGEFILYDVPAGRQELYVDGSTANRADAEYGQFIAGVDVQSKRYTQLPYTMYVPKISTRDKVKIRSPLIKDTVLTHPAMPGLEVLIPAGTVIRDRKGKLVTELALVPTPVNRAPFPVTENFPMYFTIEPGGAVIQGLTPEAAKGIRVSYPNYGSAKSAQSRFWIYDSASGWQVYGKGALSRDGSQFIAEQGVALHRMTGGAFTVNHDDPAPEPDLPEDGDECGCSGSGGVSNAGDPIDLKTGAFINSSTDIVIRDVLPISLGRSYRTHDARSRIFGIGTTSNYGYTLYTSLGGDYDQLQLVLPNGAGLEFDRIGPRPPSYSVSSWRHTNSTGNFAGSVIETVVDDPVDGEGYRLTKLDGTILFFESSSYSGDLSSRLRYIRNKHGHQIRFIYSAGLLTKIISPNGRYIDLNYDSDNRVSTAVDHTGRTWAYTYSTQGMLTRVTYPDTTHEDITYDTDSVILPNDDSIIIHRITSITNRRGFRELLNSYESALDVGVPGAYRVIKQTLADNSEINIQYEHFNGTNYGVLVTEADGRQRRVVFDTWRYPASESLDYGASLEQTFQFERDPLSQRLTARIDPMGRRTEYTYDANGLVSQVVSLAGTQDAVETSFTYNVEGLITSVTDPLNQQTTFDYLDRCLTQATDPLGHSTIVVCNDDGLPESITNALGKTTHLYYSGGQLIASVDAMNRATGYAYDALGRVVVVRDPQGQIWRKYYDTNDRVIKTVDPLGYETQLGYDGNGNVVAVLKPHGNGMTYDYDNRDRLLSRTDSLGQSETWTHDVMGRTTSHTDRKGQLTQYGYDALGRLITTIYYDGSVITGAYDAGNRLLSLSDTAAGVLTWNYDGFNRVVSEVGSQGNVSYGYDAAGRRTHLNAASQAQVVYDYDAAGRLTSIQQGTEVIHYVYDAINRVTQMTLPNGVSTGYAYNDANQLTGQAYLKADGTSLGDLGYGYDSSGRLIAQTGTFASSLLPSASSTPSTFDDNHRQIGWNGQTLSYDANGNLISDGTRTFSWNPRNQLVEVKQGSTTVSAFAYDAVGRRISKTEGGTIVTYLYDGQNAVQETTGSAVNAILSGLSIDQRYARNDAVGRTYYLVDALGSTRALTNSSGTVVQRYDYTPYGQSTQTSVIFNNPYLYTGRELDKSGLYYYRARYYSASMGRFVSEDPIGISGGLNTYSYVNQSPLDGVDPFGLQKLSVDYFIFKAGGGIDIYFDYNQVKGFQLNGVGLRGGGGQGAGISWDPAGERPDKDILFPDPCQKIDRMMNSSVGLYASGAAVVPPLGPWGASLTGEAHAGVRTNTTQNYDPNRPIFRPYGDANLPGLQFGAGPKGGAATWSAGVEVIIY